MKFTLEQIMPWDRLGGDIHFLQERLRTTAEMVVFESNEPQAILLSLERYQALTGERPRESDDSCRDVREESPATAQMKVGAMVKYNMEQLLERGELSDEELAQLCDAAYCKNVFRTSFPVLKMVEPRCRRNEVELHRQCVDAGGYLRFYKKVYSVHGKCYILSNGWKEHPHRGPFLAWLQARHAG